MGSRPSQFLSALSDFAIEGQQIVSDLLRLFIQISLLFVIAALLTSHYKPATIFSSVLGILFLFKGIHDFLDPLAAIAQPIHHECPQLLMLRAATQWASAAASVLLFSIFI